MYVERIPRRTWRNDEVSRQNRQEGLSGPLFHPDSVIHSGYQRHPAPCFPTFFAVAVLLQSVGEDVSGRDTGHQSFLSSLRSGAAGFHREIPRSIRPSSRSIQTPFSSSPRTVSRFSYLGFLPSFLPSFLPFLRREILNIQIFLCERGKLRKKTSLRKEKKEREGEEGGEGGKNEPNNEIRTTREVRTTRESKRKRAGVGDR